MSLHKAKLNITSTTTNNDGDRGKLKITGFCHECKSDNFFVDVVVVVAT
jgi:hypothetical protein